MRSFEPPGSINKATKLPFSAFDPAVRMALFLCLVQRLIKKFFAEKAPMPLFASQIISKILGFFNSFLQINLFLSCP